MKEGLVTAGTPDPRVPEKATRRKFSAEYKLRILRLADGSAPLFGQARCGRHRWC